jgi:hypothetical protein
MAEKKLILTIDKNISDENFDLFLSDVDNKINFFFQKVNIENIRKSIDLDVDIKNITFENFQSKILEVSENKSYFSKEFNKLEGFIKLFDEYIKILKDYLVVLSDKKKADALIVANVYLKDISSKKEFLVKLLSEINSQKESFDQKYTCLSRLITYWELEEKLSSNHSSRKSFS